MKIVVSHTNADLDALACMIAASRLFGAVPVGGASLSPPVHRFLALHKDHYPLLAPQDVVPEDVAEVIVVDVRDRRRLRDVEHLLDIAPRVTAWDHHPACDSDIASDEAVVEPVGACITLLVERMIEQGVPITPDEATLYLLGLYSDTGRLSYATTRSRDLDVASFLIAHGAQLKVVNRYLRHSLSPQQGKLLLDLLDTCREISVNAVEIAIATAEAHKTIAGASTVVQQVMELGGHDAMFGVLYFAKNKRVQIIARSRVSYVDVGEMMKEFGGGGHRGAAAGSVKDSSIEEVTARLETMLRAAPMHPTRVHEIMTSPVHFLSHDTTLSEAHEALRTLCITGAPVMRDGKFCGVLSKRDIQRARLSDSLHLPVSSHMSHTVTCVDSHEPIEDALEMMSSADVGRMPVMHDGEVVGIITRSDLIRLLYMATRDDSDLNS